MAKKSAKGTGTIRKKTVTRSGRKYTYWEARYTTGFNPGTGKQIQRSITGKTQKEVAQRLKAVTTAIDAGTYTAPCKMTVGEWLTVWERDYLGSVKSGTTLTYKGHIKNHIRPALGSVKLVDLRPHMVQGFVNGLSGLATATVRVCFVVLHAALEKAVELEYIPKNPAARCVLPKRTQKEVRPLDDAEVTALLQAAKGGDMEYIINVALFTGLRLSEILGLTWDCVDFKRGTVSVTKQLARKTQWTEQGYFETPKSGKPRTITPARAVMETLNQQKTEQISARLRAGELWDNSTGLVFTNEIGQPLTQGIVRHRFLSLLRDAGIEQARFHDLRHTYAVNAIRAGDDIKTIQSNLGHASAGFTLDKYGHFTEQMKTDSAARMDSFMDQVLGL